MENIELAAETAWPPLKKALDAALDQFVQMRKREGKALAADLRSRALAIQRTSRPSPSSRRKSWSTIVARFSNARPRRGSRSRTPTSGCSRRSSFSPTGGDISEELTRLRSHLDQFLGHLDKDEPVGRTLDFLLQELFRETNTIGNKANFLAISQIVVGMKTELEKLREQVQNIE